LAPKVEDLKKAITPKTKAFLLSYYFGCNFDATEIYKVAKEHNLLIIEDAAEVNILYYLINLKSY
jgi:dTDP-4-amino-4,6-dideoxygalactose transaminase